MDNRPARGRFCFTNEKGRSYQRPWPKHLNPSSNLQRVCCHNLYSKGGKTRTNNISDAFTKNLTAKRYKVVCQITESFEALTKLKFCKSLLYMPVSNTAGLTITLAKKQEPSLLRRGLNCKARVCRRGDSSVLLCPDKSNTRVL